MRVLTTIGRYSLASTLLAVALQSAYANEGISYTWVEGGASRVAPKINHQSVHLDGGYLRGSFALGDNFYLLGGYSQNSGKWKKSQRSVNTYDTSGLFWSRVTDDSTQTTQAKEKLAQSELGLGFHLALPGLERVDATAELVGLHWRQESRLTAASEGSRRSCLWGMSAFCTSTALPSTYTKTASTERVWGGKALLGLRMQPFDSLELWTKAGYSKMGKNLGDALLGNLGVQFRITNNFGLVGEADIFDKQANQYRIGARFSF